MPRLRAIVALGRVAHESILKVLGLRKLSSTVCARRNAPGERC